MTLLEKVKVHLRVSGDDENLEQIIARAKAYLDNLTGVSLDFDDLVIEELLLNRCRYVYNNAAEYFEENFKSEILRLQLQKAVEVKALETEI